MLQVRVPAGLAGAEILRAARLRALCPPDVDASVAFRDGWPPSAPRPDLHGSTE